MFAWRYLFSLEYACGIRQDKVRLQLPMSSGPYTAEVYAPGSSLPAPPLSICLHMEIFMSPKCFGNLGTSPLKQVTGQVPRLDLRCFLIPQTGAALLPACQVKPHFDLLEAYTTRHLSPPLTYNYGTTTRSTASTSSTS